MSSSSSSRIFIASSSIAKSFALDFLARSMFFDDIERGDLVDALMFDCINMDVGAGVEGASSAVDPARFVKSSEFSRVGSWFLVMLLL